MPIIVPQDLPARSTLDGEHVFTIGDQEARAQDIRALQVVLLNLMPTKLATETQIARMLANTPLQVELTLLHTTSRKSKNTDPAHLETFYQTFDKIRHKHFDGLIVTGAPVEQLDWPEVEYWDELAEIFDWSRDSVRANLFLCWGAQAALHHFHGLEKRLLPSKKFGIFHHRLIDSLPALVRGQDDEFLAPVSRHTEVLADDVRTVPGLQILAESDAAGLHLVWDPDQRRTYVFNHPEYDADTLDAEYRRDIDRGLDIQPPRNYYPDDDPTRRPRLRWRSHGQLLFTNWLNHEVYQPTSLPPG